MRFKMLLVLLTTTMLSLVGCSSQTLDWRNAQVNDAGKIYSKDSNTPFTGHLTAAPDRMFYALFPQRMGQWLGLWYSIFPGTDNATCDADIKDGIVNGKVVCTLNGHEWDTFTFTNGVADGPYTVWHLNTTTAHPMIRGSFSNGHYDGTIEIWGAKDSDGVTMTLSCNMGHCDKPVMVSR